MSNKKMVFLFISVFIGVIFGTFWVDRVSPITVQPNYHFFSEWRTKERMVDLMEPGSTVIFGDSTARGGYKPNEINSNVYNFALDGTTPIEAYFFLKYMINRDKRPKNVVLTFDKGHYFTIISNYWDVMLAFHSDVIAREDAKEILSVDQKSAVKLIRSYDKNSEGETVRIPYYYDVAIGALKQIKPDFTKFANAIITDNNVQRAYFKSRGNGFFDSKSRQAPSTPLCTDKDKYSAMTEVWKSTVILHYLEELVNFADKEKINVYIMGGPIAESCVNVGFPVDWVKFTPLLKFKTIHFEYSQAIPMPDTLMINRNHASREGASYFSQKIKPFFDAME